MRKILWKLFGYPLPEATSEDVAHADRQIALRHRIITHCRAILDDRGSHPAAKVRQAENDLARAEQTLLQWEAHKEELIELEQRHADRERVAKEEAEHKARLRAELEQTPYFRLFHQEFGCYPDEEPGAAEGNVEFSKAGATEEHRLAGKW